MSILSKTLSRVFVSVAMAVTPLAFAANHAEAMPENMQGMKNGGGMGMMKSGNMGKMEDGEMKMMSKMTEMMDSCNKMMKSKMATMDKKEQQPTEG